MSRHDEDGPVYYREIQKNAYLKRIPEETGGSKLRPLGHKKLPLKPMWTLFCVHNGRVPYLEQYPSVDAPCTASHRPLWRACLRTARHVTASVTPRGSEHDFLIHTDSGPLRLLAPDWESMQDWVTTLRSKLHELKILPKGENVYCAAPAPPPPRAGTRDPTSPLPPTPPVPPDRVPGIELVPPIPRPLPVAAEPTPPEPEVTPQPPANHTIETTTLHKLETENIDGNIDISDWDTTLNLSSLPSTSNTTQSKDNTKKKLKICGQNICLDNSIFNRTNTSSDDEEFFTEMDRINGEGEENGQDCTSSFTREDSPSGSSGPKRPVETGQNGQHISTTGLRRLAIDSEESGPNSATACFNRPGLEKEEGGEMNSGFKQRLVVGSQSKAGSSLEQEESGEYQSTNITVIQVSNKPPHTAIPVLGSETDVFNFDFKHSVSVSPPGTTDPPTYRQNLAVKTSENPPAEQYVNVVNTEAKIDSNYGAVFADEESDYGHISLTTTVSLTGARDNEEKQEEGIYERLCLASTSSNAHSPLPIRKLKSNEKTRKSSLPNLDLATPAPPDSNPAQNQTYEYLYPGSVLNMPTQGGNSNSTATPPNPNTGTSSNAPLSTNSNIANANQQSNVTVATPSINNHVKCKKNHREPNNQINIVGQEVSVPSVSNTRLNYNNRPQNPRGNYVSSVPVSGANMDGETDALRSNIERSHSQNAYDSPRLRDRFIRRENSNKPEVKSEVKPAQSKPIWKRGLTELSLLSRLRGIGQGKRSDSPTRNDANDRAPTSPAKVQHRSRRESGGDSTRRRSSSLSNGQSPQQPPALQSLRAREAAALRAAQARGAALPARVPRAHAPLLCEHDGALWVAWWGGCGAWHGGRAGDRVAALRGRTVSQLAHARSLLAHPPAHKIDILFHRVPLAKIYILNKEREDEGLGIKLDNDCTISSVEANSPAARAGLPPAGAWAVTECNNRPLNLVKGGQEDLCRLSACGKEVSVLVQPAALAKKLRATMKANKSLLGLR